MNSIDEIKVIAKARKSTLDIVDKKQKELEQKLDVNNKKIDQLIEIVQKYDDKEITVNVEQPDITIQPPEVNVTVPEIVIPEQEIKVESINSEQLSTLITKVNSLLSINKSDKSEEDYSPHDQAKSGVFQYNGFLKSDGSWKIQRIAKKEQRYALGKGDYSEAWKNRKDLKYRNIDGSE